LFKFPISRENLEQLKEDDLASLVKLDQNGLIIGNSESFEQYKKRLTTLKTELLDLEKELKENDSVNIHRSVILKSDQLISEQYFNEAADITKKYSFSITWAPGFFAVKTIGLFVGGFTLISDSGFPIFILKSSFMNKIKWLWYNRTELLTHELCHIARAPLADDPYEEFFAYRLSFSKFRRYVGNCFRSPLDSVFLLIPFFLLLAAELLNFVFNLNIPEAYFWIICFAYPLYLLERNRKTRKIYFNAKKSLTKHFGKEINTEAILFRSVSNEISKISTFLDSDQKSILDYIKKLSNSNLRWKVIYERFFRI